MYYTKTINVRAAVAFIFVRVQQLRVVHWLKDELEICDKDNCQWAS